MPKRRKRKSRGKQHATRGGSMSRLRGGMKGLVGQSKGKESLLSKIVWYAALVIAIGLLIHRINGQ